MSLSREDELLRKIQKIRQGVRSLPPGSDVCGFLDENCSEFVRLLREVLTKERASTASSEADFSPSGVPALPERKTVEPVDAGSSGDDHTR